MTQRRFIPWPDARLRRAAEPVSEITDEIRRLWDDMIETRFETVRHGGVELRGPRRVALLGSGEAQLGELIKQVIKQLGQLEKPSRRGGGANNAEDGEGSEDEGGGGG